MIAHVQPEASAISLRDVTKRYGQRTAVEGLNLEAIK